MLADDEAQNGVWQTRGALIVSTVEYLHSYRHGTGEHVRTAHGFGTFKATKIAVCILLQVLSGPQTLGNLGGT